MGKDLKGRELGAGYSQLASGVYKKSFRYDGKQSSVTGKTIKECEKKYNERIGLIESGRFSGDKKPILDEFYKSWIEEKEADAITLGRVKINRSVRGSTVVFYNMIYKNHISPALGKKKVNKINGAIISQFVLDIADIENNNGKGYASKTINSIFGLLKQLLKSAYNKKYITSDISGMIPIVGDSDEEAERKEKKREALKEEHLKLFLECAKDSYYYNAIRMLIATGMRQGELRGLMWSDYDKENMILHIRRTASVDKNNKVTMNDTKTSNGKRDIKVTQEIKAILDDVWQQERIIRDTNVIDINGFIFKSINGKIMSKNGLRSAFVHTCERAKKIDGTFVEFTPHKLRHNFVTTALAQGIDTLVVQDIVGHKLGSDITEKIYRDKDIVRMNEAMEKIKILAK